MTMKKSGVYLAIACALTTGCQTVYERPAALLGGAQMVDQNGQDFGSYRVYSHGSDLILNLALNSAPQGKYSVTFVRPSTCDPATIAPSPMLDFSSELPKLWVAPTGTGTMSAVIGRNAFEQLTNATIDPPALLVQQDQTGTQSIMCGIFTPA